MFGLGLASKINVGIEAVDIRNRFEGLYGLVRDRAEELAMLVNGLDFEEVQRRKCRRRPA